MNFLDFIYFRLVQPIFLYIRMVLDLIFIDTLSFLHFPPAAQIVCFAAGTALLAFYLRHLLQVEKRDRRFRESFIARKAERDNIGIVTDKKSRDAMYGSADQSLDEDFNTYLAQYYFRYVLIYLLPLFLVMAWLNSSFNEDVLPVASGQPYLFLLSSQPFGMQGISVTLLFLVSYIVFLVLGFQIKKRFFHKN